MTLKPNNIRYLCTRSIVPAIALFLTAGSVWAGTIRISWDPERVSRGGVVLIRVQSPVKLLAAEATTGSEKFPLIQVKDGEYFALVGVNMNQDGPTIPVDFTFFPARGGPPYSIRADLRIRDIAAAPEEQRLSLPTGMVDFSEKRFQQIRRDNEMLRDTLDARVHQRFWSEGFQIPVKGRITTRFGTKRVLNGKPRAPHNGVDIAGPTGTPVKASNRGKIVLVDSFYLSGQTVVVDHGWGVSTIYAHLDSFAVCEGQEVERGQNLGTVGSTGRATGPHLHFGAIVRGAKVDPLQLIEVTRDLSGQD
jgi:murein DD-endopeptidase MepM/ murein hydrolase activator NlpD